MFFILIYLGSGMKTAVVVPRAKAQSTRKLLEERGLWDKTRRLQKQDADNIAIPINTADVALLASHLCQKKSSVSIISADLPAAKAQALVTPRQQLLWTTKELLKGCDVSDTECQRLLSEVPSHWEKHGDLVLLPADAFVSQEWSLLGQKLWMAVAESIGAVRVARQAAVCADGYRSPQVELLLGRDGVVQHSDNGIRYEYDVTQCMFSAGNITEKLRIANFDCRGETVVDLYAGIGYFTLPYLVHAHASHVHACEWNPHAVTALRRNLELNNIDQRCTIHCGDNRQLQLRGVADRVNLGLIPSSEDGWPVACSVLKPTGGVLHIHGNVNSRTSAGEKLLGCPGAVAGRLSQVSRDKGGNGESLHQDCSPEGATAQGTQPGRAASFSQSVWQGGETAVLGMSGEENVAVCPEHSSPPAVPGACRDSKDSLPAESGENRRKLLRNLGSDCGPISESGHPSCLFSAAAEPVLAGAEACRNTETGSSPSNCGKHSSACPQSATDELPQTDNLLWDDAPHRPKTEAWRRWGEGVCRSLKRLLEEEHGGCWLATVMHIEPVKSYAPHVHHLVLDVLCTPQPSSGAELSSLV